MSRVGIAVSLIAVILVFSSLAAPSAQARGDRRYYFVVTKPDGQQSVETLTIDEGKEVDKGLQEEFVEKAKAWVEKKKGWTEVAGDRKFPVPPPLKPKVHRRHSVSGASKSRRERYNTLLDKWDVCLVRNTNGERLAEVLRHDKLYARKIELLSEYADLALEYYRQRKENPDATDNAEPPDAPVLSVVKQKMESMERAEKYAEAINAKLAKLQEKKEAE
ncbi:MAG: hypothetical protein ACOC8E_01455 [Planctomycetota bacterium]